jgi:hypothetical protein
MEMKYPLYAMKMEDFMALERLEPHNTLLDRGLVTALDLDGEHKDEHVQFVSHQWLGYTEADPNGEHLRTMQAAFRRAMDDPSVLFKDEADWKAYATGFTEANRATLENAAKQRGDAQTSMTTVESVDLDASRDTFAASVKQGWVWMDYISVPQTIGLATHELVSKVLEQQALAIRSIPAYIRKVKIFWICTPSGARHECGTTCSYATWADRGWCRLEETTISLLHLADARPLLLTEPVGDPPLVTVPDFVDRSSMHVQRRTAVLTGAFSCCRLKHQVTSLDGRISEIPCDKDILRQVLRSVFEEGLGRAKAKWSVDPNHGVDHFGTGVLWGSVGYSFFNEGSYARWFFLRGLRPAIYAETTAEPDFEALGWCKPCQELTDADVKAYVESWGQTWEPDHSVEQRAGAFLAAYEGNLPMLRHLVEAVGVGDLTSPNGVGVTPLIMAARYGYDSIVTYLLDTVRAREGEAAVKSYLEHKTTAGLGLTAIDGAATRGHPSTIRLLAGHGADIHVRRTGGRTPLHSAAAFGRLECAKELLTLGADPEARAEDGSLPADLITTSCSMSAWPTTHGEELRELLRAAVEEKRKAAA